VEVLAARAGEWCSVIQKLKKLRIDGRNGTEPSVPTFLRATAVEKYREVAFAAGDVLGRSLVALRALHALTFAKNKIRGNAAAPRGRAFALFERSPARAVDGCAAVSPFS
jgi:hypothetical protein